LSISNSLDSLPDANSPSKPHPRSCTCSNCSCAPLRHVESDSQAKSSGKSTDNQEACITNDSGSSKKKRLVIMNIKKARRNHLSAAAECSDFMNLNILLLFFVVLKEF